MTISSTSSLKDLWSRRGCIIRCHSEI